MSVKSTAGLKIWLEKTGATPVVKNGAAFTAIADNAGVAELTVDDATDAPVGSLITLTGTGFPELDGNTFIVKTSAGTTIGIGADISKSSGTFAATTATATILDAADFEAICAYEIGVDANTPGTVSVATFCDPTASLPSVVQEPGNLTLGVYHDPTSAGFKLLQAAADMGKEVLLQVEFPGDGGVLIAKGTPSAFSLASMPIDGAAAWTFTLALSTKPVLRA